MLPSLPRPIFFLLVITSSFVIVSLSGMLSFPPLRPRKTSVLWQPSVLHQDSAGGNPDQKGEMCRPQHKLVFLKTHKTGSTTLASIIQRYGYLHNLTFLVPRRGHFINYRDVFSTDRINKTASGDGKSSHVGYDVLTNHARYNRAEMDQIFHNAKYVTILREPSAQFESAFYYFEIWRSMPRSKEPLKLFLDDPRKYFHQIMQTKQYYKDSIHNQHLFDFGMSHADSDNDLKVRSKIRELDSKFHLVMITEYFDESLVLLRKLLCWRVEDILYLPKGTRNPNYRVEIGEDLRAKIRSWNKADVALYKHFNDSFWRRVKHYGPTFQSDLTIFKQKLAHAYDTCCNESRANSKDRRVVLFSLKDKAPEWCHHLARGDKEFTDLIRARMSNQGVPLYDNLGKKKDLN